MKTKHYLTLLAVLGALVLGALTSVAGASASSWYVNGAALKSGEHAALAESVSVKQSITLDTAWGAQVSCTSVKLHSTSLVGVAGVEIGELSLAGCEANDNCTTPKTLNTKALTATAELLTAPEVRLIVKAASGETLFDVELSGEKCAQTGTQPIKGHFAILLTDGQTEQPQHYFKINSVGELKEGSNSPTLTGAFESTLANNESWSYH